MPLALGLGIGPPFSGSLGDAPSFSLNLLSQAIQGAFGTLDSRVSFSRGSLATVTRRDGTVGWAGHNLVPNSASFASGWTGNASPTNLGAGATVGGVATARFLAPTGGTGVGYYAVLTVPAGVQITTNYYVAAAGANNQIQLGSDSAGMTPIIFNTTTGAITGGGSALRGANAVAGGWEVWITYTTVSAGIFTVIAYNVGAIGSFDVAAWAHYGATRMPYYPTTGTPYHAPRFQFDPTDSGQRFPALALTISAFGGGVDNGNGTFTLPANGANIRAFMPLADLIPGERYEAQIPIVAGSGAVNTDWRDQDSRNDPVAAGQTLTRVFSATSYDSTFRFLDVLNTSGSVTIGTPVVRRIIPTQVVENYGPELLGTLGQFSSMTGWTIDDGTRANISGGSANYTGTGNIQVYTTSATIMPAAGTYMVTGTITGRTAGDLVVQLTAGAQSSNISANGTFTVFVSPTTASRVILTGLNGFNGSVDNVSVREYLGLINPATPNLVTNGDFSNGATGWQIDGAWSVANGVATKTAAASATIFQTTNTIVAGRTYLARWTATGATVDAIRVNVRAPGDNVQTPYINQNGDVSVVFTATVSGAFGLFGFANGVSVDNISVREISTDASLYGANLVSNGDGTSLAGWTNTPSNWWTTTGGRFYHPNSSTYNELSLPVSGSGVLRVTFDYEVLTAANTAQFFYVNGSGVARTFDSVGVPRLPAGSGTYTLFITDGLQRIGFARYTSAEFFIDNVQVREYLGDRQGSVATPLGLLIEEQRTNLITWSEALEHSSWGKQEITVVAGAGIAPDGSPTARLVVPTTASSTHQMFQLGLVASATHTFTIYAKAAGYTTFTWLDGASASNGASFDLISGAATNIGTGVGSMVPAGNGWFRCTVVAVTTGVRLYVPVTSSTFAGNGSSGVLLWGAQLEAGPFATTYIPTFGTSATRSADAAAITGANFSAFWNAAEGSIVARATLPYTVPSGMFPVLVSANDGTSNNRVEVGYLTSALASLEVVTGATNQATLYPPVAVQVRRVAAAWAANDFAAVVNGGTPQTDSAGTVPTVNQLVIGNRLPAGAINNLNGCLTSLDFYARRLPNSRLQELTAN